MNYQTDKSLSKPKGLKKFIFSVVLICVSIVILFILEFFLRIVGYGDNYRLFLDFPGKEFREYRYINPEIGKKYFQKLDYNRPCGDMFLKKKPENGFRIFVLGSSTVLGFPYDQNLIFSRILQERLQDCYPEKKIEVINTALTAINSYTLLDYMDDVLKEDPDAILIYAGHNEFYGALGIGSVEKLIGNRNLSLLHLHLLSLRLYQFMRNNIGALDKKLKREDTTNKGTLMKRIAKNKTIAYESRVYKIGIENYRKNMNQLMKKAKKRDIPVFISEVCSNVKDLEPFCSVVTYSYPSASEVYASAIKSESEGDYIRACELYYQAKDLDCIRFRASEDINEIIHKLTMKYNAHLVPMKTKYFEKASPNGLIGNDLITEHVHPNIRGYFLMADAFFTELTTSGILGDLNPVYYKNSLYYQRNWGYSELDSLVGVHIVAILLSNWPYQSLEASSDKYRETYKPVSLVDSLAFTVVTSPSLRIDEAHRILGDFYMKNGDYFKAYKEYYSNVKYDPFQLRDYYSAIHCLTLTNDFPMALKLIDQSLALKETFYANYIKGEILFLKGDYTGSLKAFNRASAFNNSMDTKMRILIGMYKVLYYSGDQLKANEILNELQKIDPGYQPVFPSEKKKYIYYLPLQVEILVNKAFELYKSGNYNEALDIFLKSLDIRETSLANRCIGDIMFMKNDSSSLVYYQKAYPDYKDNIDFLFNMGILYLRYKQISKAKKIIEEMKHLDPGFDKISLLEKEIN